MIKFKNDKMIVTFAQMHRLTNVYFMHKHKSTDLFFTRCQLQSVSVKGEDRGWQLGEWQTTHTFTPSKILTFVNPRM